MSHRHQLPFPPPVRENVIFHLNLLQMNIPHDNLTPPPQIKLILKNLGTLTFSLPLRSYLLGAFSIVIEVEIKAFNFDRN